jgi:hypothetical protein
MELSPVPPVPPMLERLVIDTRAHAMLEEPGMIDPRRRLAYDAAAFQEVVLEAFGSLLPAIRCDERGTCFYQHFDEESRETCATSWLPGPDEGIPAGEIAALAEGWRKLEELGAAHPDPRVGRMAAAFRLPCPRRNPDAYRLFRDGDGITRLHVLWGTHHRLDPFTSAPAGEVLAVLTGKAPAVMPAAGEPAEIGGLSILHRPLARWQVHAASLGAAAALVMGVLDLRPLIESLPPEDLGVAMPQQVALRPENRALLGN